MLLYLNIKLDWRKKSSLLGWFLCVKENFFINRCTENSKNAQMVYLWKKQIVSFALCQALKATISHYIISLFPLMFLTRSTFFFFYFSHLVKNRQNCANNPSSVCHSCLYDMHCIGNFTYCKIFGFS